MRIWRSLKKGQKVKYHYRDFDGSGTIICEVTKVFFDHAVAAGNGMTLFIDDDTQLLFDEEDDGNV